MRKSFPWAYSLAVFSCLLSAPALAAPVITSNLLVDLNGDATTNFLTSSGKIQAWYDAANDGSAATQQDYGLGASVLTARAPNLTSSFAMPNGTSHAIVDFDRGSVTGTNSGGTTSDYLESKVGGEARQITYGGAFTQGGDTAYDNLTGISWFTVVNTDLSAQAADGATNSSGRQQVIRSNTSDSTTRWGSYFLDTANGTVGTPDEFDTDFTPEIQSAARGGDNVGNPTNFGPDAPANQWYIVANSYDAVTGAYTSRFLDQAGNDTGLVTQTLVADPAGIGTHVRTSIGRLPTNPADSGGNYLDGQMAELLIYNSALSNADLNSVVTYLNEKYLINPTKTWTSTTTTDWAGANNWSSVGGPLAGSHVVFRDSASTVNSVNVGSAPRAAASLTFNNNQTNFQVTGLTTANTLTLDSAVDSTTDADITVTSGHPVIVGSATLLGTDSTATGDIVAGGIKDTDWFVVDIAAGASLDVQASISSVTSAGRRAHFVKQGAGVLTLSSTNQMDMRPQTTGVNGGVFINAGTLQFAAAGARGNPFAPVTVAAGAMLEFKGAGYDGSFTGANGDSSTGANGNRSILTLSGNGVDGKGALYNSVGNNRLASGGNSTGTAAGLLGPGLIVLATDTSIGVAAGTTLTVSHGITNFSAYETVGGVGGTGTAGKLTKVGAGTLIFDANNDSARNGYAQEIIINEGTFLVNSPTTSSAWVGAEHTTATNFVLPNVGDTNGLRVGQPVSITNGASSIPSTTVIAGIGTDGKSFRISETGVGFGTGVFNDLLIGAVPSALHTSPVTVNSGATFGGKGSILGSTVTVNSGGTLAPGASVGTFTVGNATIGGTLKIEFGGDAIDRLVVAGTLDLSSPAATVDFSALGSLVNGEYVFATYDVLSGSGFTNVLNLPGSLTLHHDTTNKYFSLIGAYSASLPGDYNGDNKVDSADYVVWRKGGSPDSTVAGYNLWRANFGTPPGSGSGSDLDNTSAVPEPTSLGLIVLGAAFLLGGRRATNRVL
jgi:hypothetical protein